MQSIFKVLPITLSFVWPSHDQIITIQKVYLQMCSGFYFDTHHDVTIFKVDRTV